MSILRALSQRSFALLWSGQTLSRLGDSLYAIALAWWVLQKTGSAAAMGVVLIFSMIPTLLFLLIGGVVVDRLPRLRLMLASDVLSGIVVGLMAFLAFQQRLELWHIFVMSALFGFAQAFFDPAYRAVIPDMVPPESLPGANALRAISLQAAQIIGPGVAAAIVALGGTSLAFALDALSFLISAACLLAIPYVPMQSRSADDEPSSALHDLRVGFNTVLQSPWLWVTIGIACLSTIFLSGPLEAALPLLVKQRFGENVSIFALLTSLSAVGSIIAAVALGHFKRLRWRGWLTYGAWLLASLMLLAMGLPITVVGVGIAVFIQGAAIATLGLAWINTLQECVPAELQGRVASIDEWGSAALVPVGLALAGIAADRIGAAPVFVLGGIISASIIALGLLHPAIRAVD
jgi:DHA3 family tetracycline resistance protein-like MFS transporter